MLLSDKGRDILLLIKWEERQYVIWRNEISQFVR